MTKVSIIINNYNYSSFLPVAINSALSQTYPDCEVIVVDDGSTDNSQQVIQSYGTSIKSIFKPNQGQASAFNAGFLGCTGEIILMLDSDDYFCLNKVERVIDIFNKYDTAGWFFHELSYVNYDGVKISLKRPKAIQGTEIIDFRKTIKAGQKISISLPCGLCFRRSTLNKILPMPESRSVSISDNYIKFAALTVSPGIVSDLKLATQRIHGSNTYSFKRDNTILRAEINVKTAYYLSENFPVMTYFSRRLFEKGLSDSIMSGSILSIYKLDEFNAYCEKQMNISFLVITFVRTLYYLFVSISSKIFDRINILNIKNDGQA